MDILERDISIPLSETTDPNLWTDPRVLVPVDVQALVIDNEHSYSDDKWTDLSHEKGFAGEGDEVNESDPEHLTNLSWSERRGQGIHLHWALPDSLLSAVLENESADSEELIDPDSNVGLKAAAEAGTEMADESVEEQDAGLENINFPRLPDRWLVVRTHKSGETIVTKSWVVESETKQVTRLEAWNPTSSSGSDFDPEDLTAMGPSDEARLDFTATYDCSEGRFTFHDNPGTNLVGPFNYIVCGWYSVPSEDPLNLSGSNRQQKWDDKLEELRWHVDSDAASTIAAIANSLSQDSSEMTQQWRQF